MCAIDMVRGTPAQASTQNIVGSMVKTARAQQPGSADAITARSNRTNTVLTSAPSALQPQGLGNTILGQ